jgi:hypothetical protein
VEGLEYISSLIAKHSSNMLYYFFFKSTMSHLIRLAGKEIGGRFRVQQRCPDPVIQARTLFSVHRNVNYKTERKEQ